jgi:cobalt/nickel transport system permease protein
VSRLEALLREVQSLETIAEQSTWLSRIDPRAAIIVTAAFILVVVSFDRYVVAALLPMAIFPVVLARLGNVSLQRIGSKVLLAMPFATMVGLFNPVFDTATRMDLLGHAVSGGWLSLISILLRAALTVAAALILVNVIGIYRLCAALDRMGIPSVLTIQLTMMFRYILTLSGELVRMNLARELRSYSSKPMSLAVYGPLLGHLMLRTLERAQRIHQAMLSRGFDGHLTVRHTQSWQWVDTVFLTFCLSAIILLRTTDLATSLGHLMLDIAL